MVIRPTSGRRRRRPCWNRLSCSRPSGIQKPRKADLNSDLYHFPSEWVHGDANGVVADRPSMHSLSQSAAQTISANSILISTPVATTDSRRGGARLPRYLPVRRRSVRFCWPGVGRGERAMVCDRWRHPGRCAYLRRTDRSGRGIPCQIRMSWGLRSACVTLASRNSCPR
jgi:hypothetical protein